jgi:hypothetical protein
MPDGLAKGTEITIQLETLYNPLSMTARKFVTVFALPSSNGLNYPLEQGDTLFKATKPATISSVSVTSADQTVQEHVDVQIKFTPDVEIDPGATVMVRFPHANEDSFHFDSQLQSLMTIGGLFSTRTDNVEFSIDGLGMKIKTKNPTTTASAATPATMVISKIRNPRVAGKYGSFTIEIYDEEMELIA